MFNKYNSSYVLHYIYILRILLKKSKNISLFCESFIFWTMEFAKKKKSIFLIILSFLYLSEPIKSWIHFFLISSRVGICNIIIMVKMESSFFWYSITKLHNIKYKYIIDFNSFSFVSVVQFEQKIFFIPPRIHISYITYIWSWVKFHVIQ